MLLKVCIQVIHSGALIYIASGGNRCPTLVVWAASSDMILSLFIVGSFDIIIVITFLYM
jgi:hypothetical protein